jgi:hypothetical protein
VHPLLEEAWRHVREVAARVEQEARPAPVVGSRDGRDAPPPAMLTPDE